MDGTGDVLLVYAWYSVVFLVHRTMARGGRWGEKPGGGGGGGTRARKDACACDMRGQCHGYPAVHCC